MIGSLLYLRISTPDIMLSVCLCAWCQIHFKESYLIEIKRIFRYHVGTKEIGLWYTGDGDFNFVGYLDAAYTSYKVDRKSTSGYCLFLGYSVDSWH